MVEETSRKACEAFYKVSLPELSAPVEVRAWVIVGGQLAISFMDFSFSQRYNKKKDIKKNDMASPEILDFKHGGVDFIKFVRENLPKKQLREQRQQELRGMFGKLALKSRRFHDIENRCYFHATLDLHYLSPVTYSSAIYGGRIDRNKKFLDKRWYRLQEFFNPLFDSRVHKTGLEELTVKEYEEMKNLLTNSFVSGTMN